MTNNGTLALLNKKAIKGLNMSGHPAPNGWGGWPDPPLVKLLYL